MNSIVSSGSIPNSGINYFSKVIWITDFSKIFFESIISSRWFILISSHTCWLVYCVNSIVIFSFTLFIDQLKCLLRRLRSQLIYVGSFVFCESMERIKVIGKCWPLLWFIYLLRYFIKKNSVSSRGLRDAMISYLTRRAERLTSLFCFSVKADL